MTSALVSLHVTSDTKRLPATLVRTLEWFLPGMRMAMNSQARGPRESLVASLADVTVLRLRKRGSRRWGDVVVMLPWIGARRGSQTDRHRHQWWRKLLHNVSERQTLHTKGDILGEVVVDSRVQILGTALEMLVLDSNSRSS